MKTEAPEMTGSAFAPDLLAIQWMPRARRPAVEVAIALFTPLYRHPPEVTRWSFRLINYGHCY